MKTAAALLVAAALLAGCSSSPPVISRVFGRVIYVNDPKTGARSETLGVFLVATDPDGLENLSAFYVINDDAELFWKVDSSSWATSVAEGETWLGSTSLTMPGAEPFPAGQYRVVLQSVGGDTVEDTITVPVRNETAETARYPAATVERGEIRITGPATSYEMWVYGPDGKFASVFPLSGKAPTITIGAVAGSSPSLAGGFTFRVFAWNEQAGYGVLAGPYAPESLPGS